MSDKSCPINQCKRTNMYMDSQGIMRANKDLVKNYIPTPLPTLVGKPERITALDVRIAADEAELTPSEKVYTITYNANDGTGAPSAQTKVAGTSLTLSSTEPTRSGYTFLGWNTRANGSGTSYEPGDSYTIDGNATLYAQWELTTYTVSFDPGDGTGTMADVEDIVGEYTLPVCTFTAPADKEFKSWEVNSEEKAEGATITVSEDTTVTALWKDVTPAQEVVTPGQE